MHFSVTWLVTPAYLLLPVFRTSQSCISVQTVIRHLLPLIADFKCLKLVVLIMDVAVKAAVNFPI